jgi:flagellin-like hook-associated protein FlgL
MLADETIKANEMYVAYLKHELELLDKKAQKKGKSDEELAEIERLKSLVVGALQKVGKGTVSEIQKADEELAELANVCTRASAQRLLGDIAAPSVDGPLDKAINYALNEMTQVGSYINHLEQTEDTLTISHENTTSSESTIRDADMAKEMSEYTKHNVLTQAAQAMLAQANQSSSGILSLLQ